MNRQFQSMVSVLVLAVAAWFACAFSASAQPQSAAAGSDGVGAILRLIGWKNEAATERAA